MAETPTSERMDASVIPSESEGSGGRAALNSLAS